MWPAPAGRCGFGSRVLSSALASGVDAAVFMPRPLARGTFGAQLVSGMIRIIQLRYSWDDAKWVAESLDSRGCAARHSQWRTTPATAAVVAKRDPAHPLNSAYSSGSSAFENADVIDGSATILTVTLPLTPSTFGCGAGPARASGLAGATGVDDRPEVGVGDSSKAV